MRRKINRINEVYPNGSNSNDNRIEPNYSAPIHGGAESGKVAPEWLASMTREEDPKRKKKKDEKRRPNEPAYEDFSEQLIVSCLENSLGSILESIFIFEGRIDFLKKQHEDGIDSSHDTLAKHREPHDIIDFLANEADPSKNKKYTQKILNWYKDKQFRQEDVGRIRQVLKDFETHKKKLPHSDINKYDSFHHLNSSLEGFRPKKTNMEWGDFSQDDLDHINGAGATVIHDDPKYTVREVHDQRAMDILGKGSEWCVVSNKHRGTPMRGVGEDSSYFDDYKEEHPGSTYYHVHDKETGERFLNHHESDQHLYDVDNEEQGWNSEVASKYQEGMSKTLKGLSNREKIKSHFISQEDLHAMHTDGSVYVRRRVAEHPNTRHDTLHAMHTDRSFTVRTAVAKNPNTHPDNLHAMHNDNYLEVRHAVAKNPNTRPDTLHGMHTDRNRDVKRYVANNRNTHPDTLHAMHTDRSFTVRTDVAGNPNTRPDTLHDMHTDDNRDVRAVVAYNPNTHLDILHTLHTDDDWVVRHAVAKNPNTRHDTLHALSTDRVEYVKQAVASNRNTHPDILHAMHTDDDKPVRRVVASNPNTHPYTLHVLSTDRDEDVSNAAKEALEKIGLL